MNSEVLEARLALLEHQIKDQEKKLTRLEDIEAIKKLQKAYGYYVERMMHQEIIDCFSDSPEVTLNWLEGQWLGKTGVKRYFSRSGDAPDPLFQHQVMQIAGIVDIEPDGQRANGRWYAFGGIFMARDGNVRRSFVSGIYEMEYIKEFGIWKILKIKWVIPYAVRIAEGWNTPEDVTAPFYNDEYKGSKPDIPVDRADLRYVSGYVFPFHYKHPVTGKVTSEEKLNARLKPVTPRK
jgi:hypothetical protein